jgi:asparagine synthase (glutamine-hydrolysing)
LQIDVPGHTLELSEGGEPKIERYWELGADGDCDSHRREYYVNRYCELPVGAVSSHLMSDVPVGVFLSGGLDSSAMAALTAKVRGDQIQTFSVGYGEEAFGELAYAREVADHIQRTTMKSG